MKCLMSAFVGTIMMLPVVTSAQTSTNAERLYRPRLLLERNGKNLVVLIENDSGSDVKINKNFSMDPLVGSIHFVVTVDGMKKSLVAQIDPAPLTEGAYISLESGGVYGRLFEISHFERMLNIVEKKCYEVKVYYQDSESREFHSYDGKMISNQISVCDKE